MTNNIKIGYLGTGLMGKPMCKRLLEHGYQLIIWNRTRSKLKDLVELGATAMDTPEAVSNKCDIVCLCLMDEKAVEEVVFGEHGAASGMQPGQILIDFSSIGVTNTQRFAQKLEKEVQGKWIDAPVSGGVDGATKGTLVIFVGGDKESVDYASPILTIVGSNFTLLGPAGSGQVAKSCNQIMTGSNLMLLAEMVATARKAGINVQELHNALAGSWSDSRPLQIFVPRYAARVTEPRLGSIGSMLKDLYEAIDLARSVGASVPITSMIAEQYAVCAQHLEAGLAADASNLINFYEGEGDNI